MIVAKVLQWLAVGGFVVGVVGAAIALFVDLCQGPRSRQDTVMGIAFTVFCVAVGRVVTSAMGAN